MFKDVFPDRPNALKEIFGKDKIVIGMIHCKPLPGSPFYNGNFRETLDAAVQDARTFVENGIDGLQIENAWDLPFPNPRDISFETVAGLTAVAMELRTKFDIPVGVNMLANGVVPAMAVASVSSLLWVRCNQWANAYVANEGFVEGPSAKALRYRSFLKSDSIKVFADVHVKHGSHAITADRSVEEQALDNVFFAADVLIATGERTGDETSSDEIRRIKAASKLPVIVGSGTCENNITRILGECEGAIAGTHLKVDDKWWNPVDSEKVTRLMRIVRKFRGE
ncbi:BtpA/SgcQ family protein [Mesotoga sp. H07pep.5.4]|uniref:BtpA/SgcQ family protein n=1 Tax=Mesotoga sp. TaxID=2053577 RepID=UPI000EF137D8|nr:BtpA/SgcQ family protein [Mesotoga sp. H07pep.5.4]